jgi:hypothetical protein
VEELHPDLAPLDFLLGVWRGSGSGGYPTIEPFGYEEELRFGHVGKPYLTYQQQTWRVVGNERVPSHMEFGFWRPQRSGDLEVVSAHPNGIVEIEVGVVTGHRIELASRRVARTPTAKDVRRLERTFDVIGDLLTYELRMAAVGQPIVTHLSAELKRQHAA